MARYLKKRYRRKHRRMTAHRRAKRRFYKKARKAFKKKSKYVYGVGLAKTKYAKLPWMHNYASLQPQQVSYIVPVTSIRCLGAYDPDAAMALGQLSPRGWALWSQFYNHYRVHAVKIKYTMWPARFVQDTGEVTVVQFFDDNGATLTPNWQEIYSDPRYYHYTFNASKSTMRKPFVFTRTFTPRKYYGTGYKGDRYSSLAHGVPAEDMFSMVRIYPSDGVAMDNWNVIIQCTYWVEFFERKDNILGVDTLVGAVAEDFGPDDDDGAPENYAVAKEAEETK